MSTTTQMPLPVEESRAQRLQRSQARFRDRGGIFVPSNRNTLIDILLGRKASSPRKSRSRSRSPVKVTAAQPTRSSPRKPTQKPNYEVEPDKPVASSSKLTPREMNSKSSKGKVKADDPPKRRGRPPKAKSTDAGAPITQLQRLTEPKLKGQKRTAAPSSKPTKATTTKASRAQKSTLEKQAGPEDEMAQSRESPPIFTEALEPGPSVKTSKRPRRTAKSKRTIYNEASPPASPCGEDGDTKALREVRKNRRVPKTQIKAGRMAEKGSERATIDKETQRPRPSDHEDEHALMNLSGTATVEAREINNLLEPPAPPSKSRTMSRALERAEPSAKSQEDENVRGVTSPKKRRRPEVDLNDEDHDRREEPNVQGSRRPRKRGRVVEEYAGEADIDNCVNFDILRDSGSTTEPFESEVRNESKPLLMKRKLEIDVEKSVRTGRTAKRTRQQTVIASGDREGDGVPRDVKNSLKGANNSGKRKETKANERKIEKGNKSGKRGDTAKAIKISQKVLAGLGGALDIGMPRRPPERVLKRIKKSCPDIEDDDPDPINFFL